MQNFSNPMLKILFKFHQPDPQNKNTCRMPGSAILPQKIPHAAENALRVTLPGCFKFCTSICQKLSFTAGADVCSTRYCRCGIGSRARNVKYVFSTVRRRLSRQTLKCDTRSLGYATDTSVSTTPKPAQHARATTSTSKV